MSITITRLEHCRDLGYNIAKYLYHGYSAWNNTQVVLSGGDNANLIQNMHGKIGVRKTTDGSTAAWLNPKRGVVLDPTHHTATGTCWLDAKDDGTPRIPAEIANMPTSFGSHDPLGPNGNGINKIYIPYKRTMTLFHARNATVESGEEREGARFEFKDAVVRHYSPSFREGYATKPTIRPFQYPDVSNPEHGYDHSYLCGVSRDFPLPSELALQDALQDTAHSVVGMNLNGTDYYHLGVDGTYNNGLYIIPEPPQNINGYYQRRLLFHDTGSQGSWESPIAGDGYGNLYDNTPLVLNPIISMHCAGTAWNWTQVPAPEVWYGWGLDLQADFLSEASTAGLPERLFPSVFGYEHLPNAKTAFDLLLVFVEYRYVTVTITRATYDGFIDLTKDGVVVREGYPFHAEYYEASKSSPAALNTYVWGQFRQIVPVPPKERAQGA